MSKELYNYREAHKALQEGHKVTYASCGCRLNDVNYIVYGFPRDIFPNLDLDEKLFEIVKMPRYTIEGIHQDWVEFELFGIKMYSEKDTSFNVRLEYDGSIYRDLVGKGVRIGRVVLDTNMGERLIAAIKVTVDIDGKVFMKSLSVKVL